MTYDTAVRVPGFIFMVPEPTSTHKHLPGVIKHHVWLSEIHISSYRKRRIYLKAGYYAGLTKQDCISLNNKEYMLHVYLF